MLRYYESHGWPKERYLLFLVTLIGKCGFGSARLFIDSPLCMWLLSDKFNYSLSTKYEHYVQNRSANHSISNLVVSNPIWIFLLHFVHSCSQTTVFTQQSVFQGRRLANSPRPNGAAINQMVLLKQSSKGPVRTLNMITLCKQYTDSFVYLCGVHFT